MNAPRGARSRSDCQARTRYVRLGYSGPQGPLYHSWLSVGWTRAKGTIANVAHSIPVVGDAVGNIVEGIHTGDEHVNENGQWVNNTTGNVVVAPPSEALQSQIDATQQFNRDELARVRQQLADLAAKAGVGAAAVIGPRGNMYQQLVNTASQNPLLTVLAVGAIIGVLFYAARD